MSDLKVSSLIRTLSENYANNRISFDEYRFERRQILRDIDSEFNQIVFDEMQLDNSILETEELPIYNHLNLKILEPYQKFNQHEGFKFSVDTEITNTITDSENVNEITNTNIKTLSNENNDEVETKN